MKVVFSIIFAIAVILSVLALCVYLVINRCEEDPYPDIKDLKN